jgi:hypothetical protein
MNGPLRYVSILRRSSVRNQTRAHTLRIRLKAECWMKRVVLVKEWPWWTGRSEG